jgi:murein tripeptide amidase MpaA
MISSMADLALLQSRDITVDHFSGNMTDGIELVLNERELARLVETGIPHEVLVPDLRKEFLERTLPSMDEMQESTRLKVLDNIEGFEYGSMGGFYTYSQIGEELDSMYLLYPNLITQKSSIGQSHEGLDLWMVKISDNPNDNESATEPAVYFDALHHAREPASMSTTMYFMYWLLENYGTDPQATYLVDHREMFFVPVANPDGYVYNEQTDPNGGGFWRKNRRNNGGGCFGVDINRNYSFGWGLDSGSSPDPCSETYRGPSAFSEPEPSAIRDLVGVINPTIGLSIHTFAERFLNPYGYIEEAPEYGVYSEFSSDFISGSSYLYGITAEMLGYLSSGTTRDYLHSIGCYAWTPELGSDGFWPPISSIIPIASENRPRLAYIAWVGGAFADFRNLRIVGDGSVLPNDTLSFTVGVKNRGLALGATDVHVEVTTAYEHAIPIVQSADYGTIDPRQTSHNTATPFRFVITPDASFMDDLPLVVTVTQEGVQTAADTVVLTIGTRAALVADDAESGPAQWVATGTGQVWDSTSTDAYDGGFSFADSRAGNSSNSTNSYFTLSSPVDLTNAENPRMTFSAKWSIEEGFDYARVQASTNGTTWTNLTGEYTTIQAGQPSYSGSRHWVRERIDLTPYIGQQIQVRFFYHTDGGLPGDGFYFDDFAVVEYSDEVSGIEPPEGTLPFSFVSQNFPNPFNPSTTIHYGLPRENHVSIRIFNALGELVLTLLDEVQDAGARTITWNGVNEAGEEVSSGIYFYRITADGLVRTGKMVLIR